MFRKIHFLMLFLFLALMLFPVSPDLDNKKIIQLYVDEDFGKNTDWEALFYNQRKDMLVYKDIIFIADIDNHKMLKFDLTGNLVKRFGQKGKGPGDLYYPTRLSVLDNQFLVIGGVGKQFSVYDLEGRFIKMVDLGRSYDDLVALKNNKVAFLTSKVLGGNKVLILRRYSLVVKDIRSKKEILIKTFDLEKKGQITFETKGGPFMYGVENFLGEPYIKVTPNGDLLFGISNSPKLTIYTPEGGKVIELTLNISPVKVTKELEKRYKDDWIEEVKKWSWADSEIKEGMIKGIPQAQVFYKYLPYYKKLAMDGEGNILAFKYQLFERDFIEVTATSSQGKFLGNIKLKIKGYKFLLDSQLVQVHIGSKFIYALVEVEGEENNYYKLVRALVSH